MKIVSKRVRKGFGNALFAALAVFLMCATLCAQKPPPVRPIDINVASIKELKELPGVGSATAQRIIDMRQKSGRFRRVEDLLAVRGMSRKRFEALRQYIIVTPQPPQIPAQKTGPPAKKKTP